MKVTPTCRYGHGDLEVANEGHDTNTHRWTLLGVTSQSFVAGSSVGTPLTSTGPSGNVFTLALYRCPVCGYLEMFDDEASHGSA